jgi:hypothetical protein
MKYQSLFVSIGHQFFGVGFYIPLEIQKVIIKIV